MRVEIYCYDVNQRKDELIKTWTLNQNGHAICDNAFDQKCLEIDGIPYEGKMYYPKDGEAFLRYLPWDYAGSSLVRAVLVE